VSLSRSPISRHSRLTTNVSRLTASGTLPPCRTQSVPHRTTAILDVRPRPYNRSMSGTNTRSLPSCRASCR
jgi:hypothetical protein